MARSKCAPSWVIRQLRSLPDVDVSTRAADVCLGVAGADKIAFAVWAISRLSSEDAQMLVTERLSDRPESPHVLIATRRLTERARAALRDGRISWIERDTGVCHIRAPGLLLQRGPETPTARATRETSEARATALQGRSAVFAETLLCLYRSEPIKVGDSAERAGISPGMASRILQRLDREGVTVTHGAGPAKWRELVDPAHLLDLWAREEDRRAWTRHSLYVWARTPRELYGKIGNLQRASITGAIAGTAAANLYAPTLTILPWPELWIPAEVPVSAVAEALEGELVDEGANLYVWHAPGDVALRHARPVTVPGIDQALPLVSRYRAYVEAAGAGGRSPEVAERLRADLKLPSMVESELRRHKRYSGVKLTRP